MTYQTYEKPTTAFIVSLIGGIFVLLGGVVWAAIGTVVAIFTLGVGFLLYVFLLFGITIIAGSVALNNNPRSAHAWGIVIIILGIISLFGVITALGGIISIAGGAVALSWNPSMQGPPPPPPSQY
jgi:hypothetical protein